MGFDITFHPITREELKTFVFDVIEKPSLAVERALMISKDENKQEDIKNIYMKLEEFRDELLNGECEFGEAYGFAAAAIAGYIHPYWYSRQGCISFICMEESKNQKISNKPLDDSEKTFNGLLESLVELSPDTFKGIEDKGDGLITGNYCGGGYIDNSRLSYLKELIEDPDHENLVSRIMDEDNLKALKHVINYALLNNTGILEASDIIVPVSNECYSDFDNLRADFMGTDNDYSNSREV
ncbi:MAG: hypothetical protein AB2417_18440 [Clostridiaceae bacterium]